MSAQKESSEAKEPIGQCPIHHEPAKWLCGHCGKPVCKSCKPIGLHFQVFHRECIEKARAKIEKQVQVKEEVEAPSLGVKMIAWTIFGLGIVLFGIALFLLGLSLFSNSIPIRSMMSSTVPTSLDSIPGSRTGLNWLSVMSGLIGMGAALVGMGLLNCARAARYVLLSFCWIEIVVAFIGWMTVWLLGNGFWDIPIFAALLIWYFMRPTVKQQFAKVL